MTCEPTINVNYHGSSSFFSRLIATQTMSRFLLVVLALFAVSDSYLSLFILSSYMLTSYAHLYLNDSTKVVDVQVAFARLKTDVSSSSATSSSPQQIRKAYHSRPHLASLFFYNMNLCVQWSPDLTASFELIWLYWLPLHTTYLTLLLSPIFQHHNLRSSRLKVLYGRMMQRIFKLWPTSARLVNYTKRDYDDD